MAYSRSFTNDEIKDRIQNIYAKFVSGVEPDRLSDYLIQENVITPDQWHRIRNDYPTTQDRCRTLLCHLFSIPHPRAFLVVRQALIEEKHYILEYIDNQESGCGVREQLERQTFLQDENKLKQLETDFEGQKKAWEEEKDRLLNVQKELETKLQLAVNEHQKLEQERKVWSKEKEKELQKSFESRKIMFDPEQIMQQDRETWTEDKTSLVEQIQDLQRSHVTEELRSECKLDPVLVQSIRRKASDEEKKEIRGLTILDKELFVVSQLSPEVEVYDSFKLSFSRSWNLMELSNPLDIGSCMRNKCLYILDYKGYRKSSEILRVEPNGKLMRKWSTGSDWGFGLSVTDEPNVSLTVCFENKLNEYSSDGQLIREINLSSDADFCHPFHAVKLTNDHFVVSHGWSFRDLHRVCLVDGDGKLKKSFGGKCGSTIGQTNCPIYLAVDGNGFVIVADRDNSRVLLLDSDLKFRREILSKDGKHGIREPSRILLDQENSRLFVADSKWDSGWILIFQLI